MRWGRKILPHDWTLSFFMILLILQWRWRFDSLFCLAHIFHNFLRHFGVSTKILNKNFVGGPFLLFIVAGGTLDGEGITAMMIGSYDCVSKGKMRERAYEWENVWVSVMADRFQEFPGNCKPAKLSLKKEKEKKTFGLFKLLSWWNL